jgi:hypothetical protein
MRTAGDKRPIHRGSAFSHPARRLLTFTALHVSVEAVWLM